jgi:uncharacterized membrane protein YheB (UPF0754 family)
VQLMDRDFYFNKHSMNWWLLLIPFSSALSCFLANKLFLYLLFHPVKPKRILGIVMQGIFPRKQSTIADRIAIIASDRFFSTKEVESKIADPKTLQKIMPVIEEHVDDFLKNKLKKEMPFIGMLIGDKTIGTLKKVFIDELENLFPQIMNQYASNLIADLDIKQIVKKKITSVSSQKIEQTFYQNFSKELRILSLLNAFLGLIIGFISMVVIILIK